DRLAAQPGFIERFLFPSPRWRHAAADGTERQIVIFTQAKPARHGGNFVSARVLLGAYLFGGVAVLQLNLQAAGVSIPV
ncbi:hypothetical protein Q6263_29690, partial [Klebsiella pneumoniae]|uniref:hypothetical protein n=1 Tax=Klebsiella pneumoniae TaxID=573 RepID=UPI0027321279